jgi:membrane protease YdiL (CAAX protease family)
MTEETVRVLVVSGFFMLLLLLRLEARRFGAAEDDEPASRRRGVLTQLAWYAIGAALLGAIYEVHPAPHDVLFLLVGHRGDVILYGTFLALIGLGQAAAFAWFRYGYLRLPPGREYPGAAVNSIATAIIDEATFRGALLGTLVAIGLPGGGAILISTLVFVLVTRAGGPGRHPYMLVLAFGIGFAAGWATLTTGGLGAAMIGHAVTSFAVFVCTGHAGHVPPAGQEPEEVELRKKLPEGWQDARRPLVAGRGAEPRGFAEQIEPSGFVSRAERLAAESRQPSGLQAWLRSAARTIADEVERRLR